MPILPKGPGAIQRNVDRRTVHDIEQVEEIPQAQSHMSRSQSDFRPPLLSVPVRTRKKSPGTQEKAKPSSTFQFILVDETSPEQKKLNRSIAHSHAKKVGRREKREQDAKLHDLVVISEVKVVEEDFEALFAGWGVFTDNPSTFSSFSPRSNLSAEDSFGDHSETSSKSRTSSISSASSINSLCSSIAPTIDLTHAVALKGCFGINSPQTRQMIDHCRSLVSTGAESNAAVSY